MTDRAAPTVLIAEDYPDFRARLLSLLAPLDLTCIPVANGRLAIEVLQNVAQTVDLLITDMDMPVDTGWQVIEAARRHHGAELPIIMQTGEAGYSYVQRKAKDLGITLIDKRDVDTSLLPAVRGALGLPADETA